MTHPNNEFDEQYQTLVGYILGNGREKRDRTGVGTTSIFNANMEFDLTSTQIPLLTLKKINTNSLIHELIWFISGNTNIQPLIKNNVHIWNEWPYVNYLKATGQAIPSQSNPEWKAGINEFADLIKNDDAFAQRYGNLGPVYGKQWRAWETVGAHSINYQTDPPSIVHTPLLIDQLQQAINTIKTDPMNRRIIVNSWNAGLIPSMALPPCHYTFQFICMPMTDDERFEYKDTHLQYGKWSEDVSTSCLDDHNTPKYFLSCKLNMRSSDVFLGLPFNIAQYSILLRMIAQVTNTVAHTLAYSGGEVHIYNNHVDQCNELLDRTPFTAPKLVLNNIIANIDDFKFEDVSIVDYQHHGYLPGSVAV